MRRRRRMGMGVILSWSFWAGAAFLVLALIFIGLISKVSPDPFTLRYFTPNFLERAVQYQQASISYYLGKQVLVLLFFSWVALYIKREPRLSALGVAGFIFLLFLGLYILTLPLDFYRGFVVEHRFALSTQSVGSWFWEHGKNAIISLAITTASLTGLYLLMRFSPRDWWFLAGVVATLFFILSTYLFPVLIDPLFYNFSPLEDEHMNKEILTLAQQADIEIDEVLVADASRATVKANAYFSGLGKTKRIVIYDNLLTGFSREEVRTVIAHEIGHWKHAHIFKNILISSAGTFIIFYLFKGILVTMGVGLGIKSLVLAILFFSLVNLTFMPAQNFISRSFERQADREALQLTENPEAFVRLKQNLGKVNLAVVEPHPIIKTMLYSHPPIIARIRMAVEETVPMQD